jgi:hypothetical protein
MLTLQTSLAFSILSESSNSRPMSFNPRSSLIVLSINASLHQSLKKLTRLIPPSIITGSAINLHSFKERFEFCACISKCFIQVWLSPDLFNQPFPTGQAPFSFWDCKCRGKCFPTQEVTKNILEFTFTTQNGLRAIWAY